MFFKRIQMMLVNLRNAAFLCNMFKSCVIMKKQVRWIKKSSDVEKTGRLKVQILHRKEEDNF